MSLRPVSYGVYLSGTDHLRETESPRLRSRTPGQRPPTDADSSRSSDAAVKAFQAPPASQQESRPAAASDQYRAGPDTVAISDEAGGVHPLTSSKATKGDDEIDWSATRR